MSLTKLLAFVFLSGCAIPSLDLSSRRCPCGGGLVCNETTQRCEARQVIPSDDASRDAPSFDSSADANVTDGAVDSTVADARMEASVPDAGVDAAPQDTGVVETGVDATMPVDTGPPPTFCQQHTNVACADFESGLDPLSWSAEREGSHGIVRTRAASGTQSLRVDINAGGVSNGQLNFTPPGNRFWVRFSHYVPDTVPVSSMVVFRINADEGVGEFDLKNEGNDIFAFRPVNTEHTVGHGQQRFSERWECWEIEFVLDGADGHETLYRNGSLVGRNTGRDSSGIRYRSLSVGITYSGASQSTGTIFYDDVIVSQQRTPCGA